MGQTLLTVINTLHKSISETEFLPQYIYFVFSYRISKPINGNLKGFVNSFPGYIAKGVTVGSGRVIQNQSPTVFLLLLLPNLSQHCLLCMKNIRETFTVQSLWYAQFQSQLVLGFCWLVDFYNWFLHAICLSCWVPHLLWVSWIFTIFTSMF